MVALTRDEIKRNEDSIRAIPKDVLPKGDARDVLIKLAHIGCEVYGYRAGPEESGVWNIWCDQLAMLRPDKNGRNTVAEWLEHWDEWLKQIWPQPKEPEVP